MFAVGLIIGVILGVVVMSMVFVAKDADRGIDCRD